MNSGELQDNTPNKFIKVETKTALTFDIANALKKKVLNGEAVFKRDSQIILEVTEETEGGIIEKTIELSTNTVMSWVSRDMIIPETNKTLRTLLNEAREQRDNALTKRQKQIVKHLAMRELTRLINMPITSNKKEIVVNYIKDKNGKDIEVGKAVKTTTGDDAEKMRLKVKNLHYMLDRLDDDFKKPTEKIEKVANPFSFLVLANREQEMIKEGKLKAI